MSESLTGKIADLDEKIPSDLLTLNRLRIANVIRSETSFHHKLDAWSVADWAVAMAGECGEACDQVKKLRRLEDELNVGITDAASRETIIRNIGKELADVVLYADLMAARIGLRLDRCIIEKFNEVSDRRGSDVKLAE